MKSLARKTLLVIGTLGILVIGGIASATTDASDQKETSITDFQLDREPLIAVVKVPQKNGPPRRRIEATFVIHVDGPASFDPQKSFKVSVMDASGSTLIVEGDGVLVRSKSLKSKDKGKEYVLMNSKKGEEITLMFCLLLDKNIPADMYALRVSSISWKANNVSHFGTPGTESFPLRKFSIPKPL